MGISEFNYLEKNCAILMLLDIDSLDVIMGKSCNSLRIRLSSGDNLLLKKNQVFSCIQVKCMAANNLHILINPLFVIMYLYCIIFYLQI